MSKESDLALIDNLAAQSGAIWREIEEMRLAIRLIGEADQMAAFLCRQAYESEDRHIERMQKKHPFLGYGDAAQMTTEAAMVQDKGGAPKYHVEHIMLKRNPDGER